MATLTIEATPGEGLREYRFELDEDRRNIPMAPKTDDPTTDIGEVEANGNCGDGSEHRLFYSLAGTVGSTLGLKVFCEGTLRLDIPLEIFGPAVVVNSNVSFSL
jgi:hypothetical protein